VEYVLPLRWQDDAELEELTAYLLRLTAWADVTVVDGSPTPVFDAHASAWSGRVRHLSPWPGLGRNGKVAGVVTGVTSARHELVVIADDDIRYDKAGLEQMAQLVALADLVRPQNYFDPLPWHARWDTGRTLLNRALAADFPGTFGLRRSTFLAMGAYDGDVLFENLELCRTVVAAGGTELRAPWLYIARRPPSTRHFFSQRVRQAYDDFAQPGRLIAECAVLPALVLTLRRAQRPEPAGPDAALAGLAGVITTCILVAEVGRRRDGGAAVFSARAAFWAPAWLLERSVCVWLAVGSRLRGGARYGGQRIRIAAHSTRFLRRRLAHP
jgi:hypothetical protein